MDAGHLAKGDFDAINWIVWRPDVVGDAQARNARRSKDRVCRCTSEYSMLLCLQHYVHLVYNRGCMYRGSHARTELNGVSMASEGALCPVSREVSACMGSDSLLLELGICG